MKIIDLLNKIAKGEEVPRKIAIQNEVLIYNENEILNLQDCYYMVDDEDATWKIWAYELNEEVEILEEKKIPEKLKLSSHWNGTFEQEQEYRNKRDDKIAFKINEIIDYLDYLKNKGDE